ncbi:MAG: hypothetical protein KC434_17380, partial [Anaerolineales bacterium]|nr:hypothetical protein [Anaerolineales bacterium]
MKKLMRLATGFLLLFITLAVSCGQEPPEEATSDSNPTRTAVPEETAVATDNTPLPPPAVATTLPTSTPAIAEETANPAVSLIPTPIYGPEGALVSL